MFSSSDMPEEGAERANCVPKSNGGAAGPRGFAGASRRQYPNRWITLQFRHFVTNGSSTLVCFGTVLA